MYFTNTALQTIPALYQWGIDVIKAVQTISNPVLTEIIKFFTDASTYGFVVFVFLIYIWCIDYKKGLHLGYVLTFGAGISDGIKLMLRVPRPYTYAPEIKLASEKDFSTPSGHSFISALMYPSVLFYEKKTRLKNGIRIFLAVFFPFAIGFSRIYLGVHYPTDVLAGWAIGGLISFCFIAFTGKIIGKIETFAESLLQGSVKNTKTIKFAAAAFFSFFLIVICKDKVYSAGALFGLAFGNIYILEPLKADFSASNGTVVQKIIRFVLGVLISALPVAVIYFMKINSLHPQFKLYNFSAFFASGAIISGVMPLIFVKLKLDGEKNANR